MRAGLSVADDPTLAAAGMAVTTTSSTPRPSRPTTITDKSAAWAESEVANAASVMKVAIVRSESVRGESVQVFSDRLGHPQEIPDTVLTSLMGMPLPDPV